MKLSQKSLAGPGFVILNVLKVMNIIGFLAVIAASVVMLIKTSTASSFFFFDAVTHVVTAVIAIFLIVSEIGIFSGYFARNWPLLSPDHGFIALAAAMTIIGVELLACLNKPGNSQEHLGMTFWRIIIGAGILIFILGFLNLISSFVFRDKVQGITARQVRAHGAAAEQKVALTRSNTGVSMAKSLSSATSGNTSLRSFRLNSRDESTLPSYHSPAAPEPQTYLRPQEPVSPSLYSRATWCSKKMFGRKRDSVAPPLPSEISAPNNYNSQFSPWLTRPDSTLHPSRDGEGETHRWRAQS